MDGESTLNFEGALPPLVVALLAALMVGAAAWTARRSGASFRARAFIVSLRAVAAVALAVALLGPSILTRDDIVLRPRAMVLMDASQSMGFQDMPGNVSRRQTAIDQLARDADAWRRITETHEVSLFDFGANLREAPTWVPAADDRVTAAGDAIPEAVRRLKGRPGGSLVIISDGRTTAGADPVRAAAGARERGVVVHTVGVGKAGPANLRDRKVTLIHCPGVAQIQAVVPIQAYIVARGEQGAAFQARLKIDDKIVDTKDLTPGDDKYSTRVSFQYTPATLGEKRVTVDVDAVDGEFDSKNNSMSTFVRVVHKDLHVVCLEGKLRWEFTFLRRALAQLPDSHIATHSLFLTEKKPDPSILENVHVVIIGDTVASRLGQDFLHALERHVSQRDGGLLFLAGAENLTDDADWEGTPMESLLPFSLKGVRPPAERPTSFEVTQAGMDHFALMLDRAPERNATAWQSLPKLEAFALVGEPKPAATVLAESEDRAPLLISQPYGKGRTLAFLGEMSWKWALEADGTAEKYKRFWHQCVLWLARKEKSARRLSVDLPRYLYLAGDPVDVSVSVENPPGSPVEDATVRVTVEGPEGALPAPAPAWFGGAYRATVAPPGAGDYRVTVEARRGEDDFGQATARFTAISPSAELDQPAPDVQGMMATSAAGGGLYRPLSEIREVFDRMATDSRPVRIERVQRKTLWDRPWLVLVFVGALALEWIARRRVGMS